jgi:hypothetical protein
MNHFPLAQRRVPGTSSRDRGATCRFLVANRLRVKALVACLSTLALLLGCTQKREVSGQVFISTQGGVSFKLGSVPVLVYRREAFRGLLFNYAAECGSVAQEFQEIDQRAHKEEERANREYQMLSQKRTEVSSRRVSIDEEVQKLQKLWQDAASTRFSAASKERLSGIQTKVKELLAEKESLGSNGLALTARMTESVNTTREVGNELSAKAAVCLKRLDMAEDDFYSAKSAVLAISTDADGDFKLVLPDKANYTMAARARRLVGAETEEYCWVKDIGNETKQHILLNNLNTVELGLPQVQKKTIKTALNAVLSNSTPPGVR